MEKPHGEGIAKDTGDVSKKDKQVTIDIMRRMAKNINKEQESAKSNKSS